MKSDADEKIFLQGWLDTLNEEAKTNYNNYKSNITCTYNF